MDNEKENKEIEFDPTKSDAFYENLNAAIGFGEDEFTEEEPDFPEISLNDELNSIEIGAGKTVPESDEDVLFAGVDAALSEQIEQEFGNDKEAVAGLEPEKRPNKVAAFFGIIPTWTKVLVSIILVILLSVGFLFGTKPGRSFVSKVIVDILFQDVNVQPDDPTTFPTIVTPLPDNTAAPTPGIVTPEPTIDAGQNGENGENGENPVITEVPSITPVPTVEVPESKVMYDEDVVNVLLLGEENIYGAVTGRTDAILVASLNKKTGQIKLVSFLRDTYVRIPGKRDDKLNAAYTYGGVNGAKLMMETIETNFKIKLDGYVVVDFEGFENMIDELGGLRIALTANESDYLNRTAYISKPEERNTVAGYQNLTGSQVLGYCRVRYVPTAEGLKNDIGRTYRHRVVLKAIFDKYKEKGIVELLSVMYKCFEYVTTSESVYNMAPDCLQIVMEKRNFDIQTLQIPKAGHYSDTKVSGMAVLSFFPDNIDILQDFLYDLDEDE